jgi:hypothetical protein
MRFLVIQYKVIDYNYFMDELQDYELTYLLENCKFSYKDEWEQARYLMYYAVAPYSKKKYDSIADFFPLATDPEKSEIHKTDISNDEIKKMREMSAYFEKNVIGKKGATRELTQAEIQNMMKSGSH